MKTFIASLITGIPVADLEFIQVDVDCDSEGCYPICEEASQMRLRDILDHTWFPQTRIGRYLKGLL